MSLIPKTVSTVKSQLKSQGTQRATVLTSCPCKAQLEQQVRKEKKVALTLNLKKVNKKAEQTEVDSCFCPVHVCK